jgi:hypothetical protein
VTFDEQLEQYAREVVGDNPPPLTDRQTDVVRMVLTAEREAA